MDNFKAAADAKKPERARSASPISSVAEAKRILELALKEKEAKKARKEAKKKEKKEKKKEKKVLPHIVAPPACSFVVLTMVFSVSHRPRKRKRYLPASYLRSCPH
jgi:hypothetical protein